MNDIDMLRILRGKDYAVTRDIIIRQPTLGEIEEFGEKRYMSVLSTFVCTPFDMIAQLDKAGIDFTEITDYQLFCLTLPLLHKEDSEILFGDTDFTQYRLFPCDGGYELRCGDSVISEPVYHLIADYLRKANNLAPPKYKEVGNEFTKQKMIEFAYDDLRSAARKPYKSNLYTLISRVTNHPYFKYRIDDVWDMKLFAFYDAIRSINIIEHTNHLYTGMYSGCVDVSKISKKQFNWMRESD